MEYKKTLLGIPKSVVKIYNNSNKRVYKLCNVHYAQFRRL